MLLFNENYRQLKPAKRRNSVVLPHPEGPRIVRNSPFLTDKLTLEDLMLHGLKSAPQGAIIVKEPLLGYLESNL